ncbi:DUF58 domain-containing protein [Legionella sp. CNM-4043-24]|uniref:DUF58 domain-containing protein n=1 Tax=Legionella sp. CNM-4043-24 TaxID=3421646 RepID=UPI00403A8332
MLEGVVAELSELIALRRFARRVHYKPEGRAARAGNHISRMRGRGMDFSEVRNYQAGDEIRHMEWRVTARTGRPHTKIYQEERERPVVILTDFSPSMHFGTRIAFKSVVAARLSALIAWTAIKQGDRLGALCYSADSHHEFMPASREASVLPVLARLSEYTRQFETNRHHTAKPMSEALLRLRRVARPGSIIVLISDFYQLNEECDSHLSRLRAHNDLLVYHVCDPLELSPPPPDRYAITDGEHDLLLDTVNKTQRDEYRRWCDLRTALVQEPCRRLQIQYTQVSASADLPRLVHQTFPRRTRG